MQIFRVHGWEAGGPGRIVGVWTREWEHFDFQVDAWWSRPAGWGVGGASLVDKVVDMVAKMVAEMEVDIVADTEVDMDMVADMEVDKVADMEAETQVYVKPV